MRSHQTKHWLFTALVLTALIGASHSVFSHEINGGQNGVIVTFRDSVSSCAKKAQQVCDQVAGDCTHYDDGAYAYGGEKAYLIMYQCFHVSMNPGSVVTLVVSGSHTKEVDKQQFTNLMSQSHKMITRLMGVY